MKLYPCCKINMGLNIIRRRNDGYHDLETVFVPVPWCDELEITASDTFSFSQSGIEIEGDVENNMVVKAYRLVQQQAPHAVGNVEIRLTKNIPFGAGLGGGSSDAAFTILMLNNLFQLGFTHDFMRSLASSIGADCAFFIDCQPAYATGIGDILRPLGFNPLQGYKLILIKPNVAVSTAEAYRGITPRQQDSSPFQEGLLPELLRKPIENWRDTVTNDFEESVFINHQHLAMLKKMMYEAGALYAAMSGSGSTIYGVFSNDGSPHSTPQPIDTYLKSNPESKIFQTIIQS